MNEVDGHDLKDTYGNHKYHYLEIWHAEKKIYRCHRDLEVLRYQEGTELLKEHGRTILHAAYESLKFAHENYATNLWQTREHFRNNSEAIVEQALAEAKTDGREINLAPNPEN